MPVETGNTKKLDDLLKPHRGEYDFLKEAFKEVEKEDGEKRKESAKELIRKAKELKGRMDQAERDFNSQKKKFDKELGKTINRLQNMANGRPLDEGTEEEGGSDTKPDTEGSGGSGT